MQFKPAKATSINTDVEALMDDGYKPSSDCLVFEAYPTIKKEFIRRVYMILTAQVLVTAAVVCGLRYYTYSNPDTFTQPNGTLAVLFWPSFIGVFISLLVLHATVRNYPTNLIVLGVFTICEAITIGVGLSQVPIGILFQAFFTTITVFIGLIVYTIQSKEDFSWLGASLGSMFWIMFSFGLLQLFFPFPSWLDLAYSCAGAIIFCGFTIFDTWRLHYQCRPDEYVFAALNLYLDFLNLFLFILRIISSRRE